MGGIIIAFCVCAISLWKLGYIGYSAICYTFTSFKLFVFSLIVAFQSEHALSKLDYH